MPSGHIRSSYHVDLLQRCGPALVKLLLDHLLMATLHPILRGKPVTSAAFENVTIRDIAVIAGNCRYIHFLPTLGSAHVSAKDRAKAISLNISPDAQPRVQYKALIAKLGINRIPRFIMTVAHAEPNVEQPNPTSFVTAIALGYYIA